MKDYYSLKDNYFIEQRNREYPIINLQINENQVNLNIYNQSEFNFLPTNNILNRLMINLIFSKMMKIENNNNYIDNKVWRCTSLHPKHDT